MSGKHYLGTHGSPEIVAFMSLIIGALLDLFRFDGQSTSILTTAASLTDMTTILELQTEERGWCTSRYEFVAGSSRLLLAPVASIARRRRGAQKREGGKGLAAVVAPLIVIVGPMSVECSFRLRRRVARSKNNRCTTAAAATVPLHNQRERTARPARLCRRSERVRRRIAKRDRYADGACRSVTYASFTH